MMRDIRIAAIVCRCPVGRVEHNLERTRYWVRQAKKRSAALVCFPEMNLTGYSNREEIRDHALSVQGREIETLVRLSVDEQIALLVGFAEKSGDGSIFATHMVITPQGHKGCYRKLHLAPPETNHYHPGDRLPIFHWAGLHFGIQLCYDAHFPELATCMAEAKADIIFIPHASPRGQAAVKHQSWMRHLPARAFDNGLFIVACNQTGNNGNGLTFPGNAVILSPSGEVIETLLTGESAMLVADLTADQLRYVRDHRMRYFLPHRRPALYRRNPVTRDLDD